MSCINQNVHANDEHQNSEELFRNLVENAPDPIIRFNINLQHIYCNAAVEHHFGIPREYFYGRTFFDIARDKNDPEFKKKCETMENALQKAIDSGCEQELQLSFFFQPGIKHFSIRIVPEKNNEGKTASLLAILRDITELMKTKNELVHNENLLDGVFASIQEGITVLDTNLTIQKVNPTQRSWHKNNLPLEGKKCYQAYHNRSEPCEACPSQRALQAGKMEKEKILLPTADGNRHREIYSYPLFQPGSREITGVVEFIRDITEHKKAQEELEEAHQRLLTVCNNIEAFIYAADMETHELLFINQYGREMLGNVEGEKCWNALQGKGNGPCEYCTNDKLLDSKGNPTGVYRWEHYNEFTGRWYDCQDSAVEWVDGRIVRLEIAVDITERRQAEEALRHSEERYRLLVENASEAIVITQDGVHKFVNPKALELFGRSEQEILSTPVAEVVHSQDRDLVLKRIEKRIEKSVPEDTYTFRLITGDGATKWAEVNAVVIDWEGRPASLSLIQDVTERKLAEERIEYLSLHDILTGFFNRAYLEEKMKSLEEMKKLPTSIVMADLNGLKLVNDTCGHEAGDEMLKQAAEALKKSCRHGDIIARFGGDEFVLLLPGVGEKEARQICSRIKTNSREIYVGNVPVSLALGMATRNSAEETLQETLKKAEDDMYKQKLAESRSTRSAVLNALLKTLEAKSYETEAHTRHMQDLALKIGEEIGLPDSELNRLNLAITLHDIGKVNIPEKTLTKQSLLTDEEWEIIKYHPEIGYRIARATEEFSHVAEEILAHHERWDGTGYPFGLKGEQIPLLARITAIVDAYEVMSQGRPYKDPLPKEDIIAEFKKCKATQFDPILVDIFLSILEKQ